MQKISTGKNILDYARNERIRSNRHLMNGTEPTPNPSPNRPQNRALNRWKPQEQEILKQQHTYNNDKTKPTLLIAPNQRVQLKKLGHMLATHKFHQLPLYKTVRIYMGSKPHVRLWKKVPISIDINVNLKEINPNRSKLHKLQYIKITKKIKKINTNQWTTTLHA